MTLQELRYIVALADKGQFVRAAQACHVGQPTLSTQLKKLEDYLGVTLFERNKHHLVPTPIGEKIVENARLALNVVDQIRELARRSRDPMYGAFRLGVFPTLGPYLIPHLLPAIRAACPDLHLFLREDLTANLYERLRQCALDALLLALPVHGHDIETLPLFRERFFVALPRGHPLAKKARIDADDLRDQDLLLLEDGHCMREHALAICGMRSPEQRDELSATSLETLRQMVAAGAGCTLLPALAAHNGHAFLKKGLVQIRPFASPDAFRTIGVVWRRHCPGEATVRGFAQLVLDHLPPAVEAIGAQAEPLVEAGPC